ncbi:MAG: glycosyltransferase [Acidobacteriota bacterium]|nr:MAG: glycosyltransferase [Acidobacteriota bacterium]
MKVLVLIEQSAPSRYWEAAVPLLAKKGVEVSFVTLRPPGPLSEIIAEKGIPVHALGAVSSLRYPIASFRLAALIRHGRYNIVHASESICAAISGVSRFISPGPVRLFHRHHNACPQKSRVFYDLANRLSDRTMTCSAFTKAFAVREDGVPEEKIRVAYNGITPLRHVEPAEIEGIRDRLGIPANAKVISIVGRLSEEKGHLNLISAARLAANRLSMPLHVVITGDGNYEPQIRRASQLADNVSVHFAGRQEDVAPWFAVGDVIAMPSYTEAFGISAVEAMCSGRPLVASGVGGLLEVVEDGVSGLLVPPEDPGSLSEAMLSVLNSVDFSRSLAEAGRKRVNDHFTMEKMVDGWIDCYNWALAKG